jgi:hypothetical protein
VWKRVDGRNIYHNLNSSDRNALDKTDNDLYIVMCASCFKEKAGQCQGCGDSFFKEFLIASQSKRNHDWKIQDLHYCTRCARPKKCRKCGKEYTSSASSKYCRSCDEDLRLVHDHTYRPFNIRYLKGSKEGSVSKKALRLGVEIEVENTNSHIDRNAMAAIVKEKYGYDWLYCVHDGTIAGGTEFVSYPFTWQHFLENRELWIDFFLLLQKHGWKVSDRCGFHVHTTKDAWTSYQLYKLCKFIYTKENHPFIIKIAERKFNSFCQVKSMRDSSSGNLNTCNDSTNLAKIAKLKGSLDPHHYNAINLRSSRTVEIRIFKGVIEPWYFFKNVEFVKALYDYTLQFPASKMTSKDFQAHILSNKKKYYYLRTFIEQYVTGTAFKKKKKKSKDPYATLRRAQRAYASAIELNPRVTL